LKVKSMMTEKEKIMTIALPKGKLGQEAIGLLADVGYPVEGVATDSRKLLFDFPGQNIRYIVCRPTDIPTYVEYGAADVGIVGKDSLVESGSDVFELLDLKFGYCRFVVAVPRETADRCRDEKGHVSLGHFNHARVATKFPQVARTYFNQQGIQVEVIKLHGNIELAPMVNLAEMIVDIVSSGATLRENGLVPIADVFPATARVIANRVSYRMKFQRIHDLVEKMREQVTGGISGK